ncbi:formimidoylglutamase [Streptomyces sp. SID8352]|uniref:formimidoylglutamase n=1 Tax=Streptomyces sp. SID8352 TaxID=2690338 RepID=UPI00136CE2D0|nr:formimidoylglutamase [Streptomyces sp. SID8352]
MSVVADISPVRWSGRTDGLGPEHQRWHHAVDTDSLAPGPHTAAFVGFRSDEGVRRNQGRPGAAAGPAALRTALSSLALPAQMRALDIGDVAVYGDKLEDAQRRLGTLVGDLIDRRLTVAVLGGGHEVAYGSYQGIARSTLLSQGARLGVLNLDAHFDLRTAPCPSSGTPFLQMAQNEAAAGRALNYWVLGISQPSNTQTLFDTADSLGVRHLPDTACQGDSGDTVDEFVAAYLDSCDVSYLTIDLDVLSAAVAPGVSAPAAFGVPLNVIERVCVAVAASGKLAVVDVAELNPKFDIDGRTARVGARLLHRILTILADTS